MVMMFDKNEHKADRLAKYTTLMANTTKNKKARTGLPPSHNDMDCKEMSDSSGTVKRTNKDILKVGALQNHTY